MPVPFPVLYFRNTNEYVEVRRTSGEAVTSPYERLMRVDFDDPGSQQGRYEAYAVADGGWPVGYIGARTLGARYVGAFAPGPKGGKRFLAEVETSGVAVAFPAGRDAVVIGRNAGSDPANLFLVRKKGNPVKIPNLGMGTRSSVILGGGVLFLSSWNDPTSPEGMVLWKPGGRPKKVFDALVDHVWPVNKLFQQGKRIYRFGWDGRRIRKGRVLLEWPNSEIVESVEIGRYIGFTTTPASNAVDGPRTLRVIDMRMQKVAIVEVPTKASNVYWKLCPTSLDGKLMVRSPLALPGNLQYGFEWQTLDLKKVRFQPLTSPTEPQSADWKRVRLFRSNGSGPFWP